MRHINTGYIGTHVLYSSKIAYLIFKMIVNGDRNAPHFKGLIDMLEGTLLCVLDNSLEVADRFRLFNFDLEKCGWDQPNILARGAGVGTHRQVRCRSDEVFPHRDHRIGHWYLPNRLSPPRRGNPSCCPSPYSQGQPSDRPAGPFQCRRGWLRGAGSCE
ncbi:hypothetical protein EDB86DRAFT_2877669 [Lactarius hatsudake]|nr:hypothetical protein EDB86DRAFT_2877669 [Lactarius hatsudake]